MNWHNNSREFQSSGENETWFIMREMRPFFSVIIPTFNHAEQLASCLRSISDLDFPPDKFEVIVVDDGSDVSPVSVVDSFTEHLDIVLVTQANAGPAAARNAGAARARGQYLAFTDDDCCPSNGWLSSLASSFLQLPDCAIGGRTINGLSENAFSTASQTIIEFVYSYYNSNSSQARFFASNNLAVPQDRFQMIGGFDPMLRTSEDRDLCERWLHKGYCMNYAPEAVVYHRHVLTFRSFWKQHFHYGRGAFLFRGKTARREKKSIRLEPKSFYIKMFRYPFVSPRKSRPLLIFVLMLLSQMASTVGFLTEWIRQARREPQLP